MRRRGVNNAAHDAANLSAGPEWRQRHPVHRAAPRRTKRRCHRRRQLHRTVVAAVAALAVIVVVVAVDHGGTAAPRRNRLNRRRFRRPILTVLTLGGVDTAVMPAAAFVAFPSHVQN